MAIIERNRGVLKSLENFVFPVNSELKWKINQDNLIPLDPKQEAKIDSLPDHLGHLLRVASLPKRLDSYANKSGKEFIKDGFARSLRPYSFVVCGVMSAMSALAASDAVFQVCKGATAQAGKDLLIGLVSWQSARLVWWAQEKISFFYSKNQNVSASTETTSG